jgi:hypothetical protein
MVPMLGQRPQSHLTEIRNGQAAGSSQVPQGAEDSSRCTLQVKQSPDFGTAQEKEGKGSNNSKTSAPSVNDINIKVDENEMRTNGAVAHGAIKRSSDNEPTKTQGEEGSAGRDSGQGFTARQKNMKTRIKTDNATSEGQGAEYKTVPIQGDAPREDGQKRDERQEDFDDVDESEIDYEGEEKAHDRVN